MEFFLWPFLFLLNPYFHGKIEKICTYEREDYGNRF